MKIATFILLSVVCTGFALFLVGCEDEDQLKSLTKPKTAEAVDLGPDTISTKAGQYVAAVKFDDFNAWIYAHQEFRIVSICPVDRSGHGKTTGFMIVFERAR